MANRTSIRAAIETAEGAPINLEGGVMATGTQLSYRRARRFLTEYARDLPWWRRLLLWALNRVIRLLQDAEKELGAAGAGNVRRPGGPR